MNKYIAIILLIGLFLIHVDSFGQTYYYKLTKKIQYGDEYTNTGGGQFITFKGNSCYDSDKHGINVGNGELKYRDDYSNSTKTYTGNSYFGNVIYRFNSDLTILNIVVNSNLIYVYKRTIPPSDAITCTLIKKSSIKNTTNYRGTENSTYTLPQHNGYTPPLDNGKTLKTKEIRYKEKCHNCRGKGSTIHNTYPPTFGLPPTNVWCSECGKYYSSDVGHSHVPCRYCGGTGEVEKVRYENVYE